MNLKSSAFAASFQRELHQLVRAYELCNQACLAENGVTASQGYTLLSLPQQGYLSMNDLSEAMGLAGSTMTRYVDQLVERGLVYRESDHEDRRVVRVKLTDRGRELRRVVERAMQEFFKQVLDELREEERSALLRTIEQVARAIEKVFRICCAG
ncbi:MAG: MarR family transcriptional regulator [Chloroflexi bacterium]|nr:MarR family transcriptional regulator [Chloroflexota bacterium]